MKLKRGAWQLLTRLKKERCEMSGDINNDAFWKDFDSNKTIESLRQQLAFADERIQELTDHREQALNNAMYLIKQLEECRREERTLKIEYDNILDSLKWVQEIAPTKYLGMLYGDIAKAMFLECQRERDELSLFRTVQERRHAEELEAAKLERDGFLNALLSITTGKANIPLFVLELIQIVRERTIDLCIEDVKDSFEQDCCRTEVIAALTALKEKKHAN
jgi:hypothetical protein